ncbi:hypothetical protein COCCADRAFT_98311 [Bipolaris zeicola 26-R-13]|uniref:Secreted protein n=1 Tax=Cochliobolus carbonum (strain 26-R-13) TaxID=930089 RepID=W6Y4L6_COCC2|nr:uncharacterized protein COCCADRAFT_98311 [Bipolaris zeicola 26-R-13]EUC32600.1 hypothetical protein COCCADRAFT_98311 [Bipolaris zeicola 26-R-13]
MPLCGRRVLRSLACIIVAVWAGRPVPVSSPLSTPAPVSTAPPADQPSQHAGDMMAAAVRAWRAGERAKRPASLCSALLCSDGIAAVAAGRPMPSPAQPMPIHAHVHAHAMVPFTLSPPSPM